MNQQAPANLLWRLRKNGLVFLAHIAEKTPAGKRILCLTGQVLIGISCVIWTLEMIRRWLPERRWTFGCLLIYTKEGLNTLLSIFCTRDLSISSFMMPELCQQASRTPNVGLMELYLGLTAGR